MASNEETLRISSSILDKARSRVLDCDALALHCAYERQGTIALLRSAAQHVIDSQNMLCAGTPKPANTPFSWFKPVE